MLPSHPQTQKFLQQGIFQQISKFSHLEQRITSLGDTEAQLALFGVFAEAYLAIRPLPLAADIWAKGTIPTDARRRYNLPERIPGTQGVFRSISGDIHPYQLLFRPHRPPLSKKDVSTFLELADRVSQPLLFSNCNEWPKILQNRSGFHGIRGADLDRLTAEDFNAIRRWLQGGGILPTRTPLMAHHARAVAGLQPLTDTQERALMLTAPGTGVEMLTLKLAEGVKAGQTVLVMLPSLAHMRHMVHLWRKHTTWSALSCLWICQDSPSGNDTPVVRQADLDFPLVTDSETVRRFLNKRFPGVRVLFTTYDSASIAARAMVSSPPVDLGIFLQSWRTYADDFSLHDDNLPLRKRLFFSTATRQYDATTLKKTRKVRPLWCLDDPERYGHVVQVAPLDVAVEKGIVRPWKMIITLVPYGAVSAPTEEEHHQIASGYALGLTVTKGMTHIQCYHNTTKESESFALNDPSLFHINLGKFSAFHLTGKQSVIKRDTIVQQFVQSKRAILNSARCLAEEMIAPVSDLVIFFCSPKKAKLNVDQALEPILAKQAGKSTGFIGIPLFLEDLSEESLEKSLSESETLWEVFQLLTGLDSSFEADIGHDGESFGRTGSWQHSKVRSRLEIRLPPLAPPYWVERIQNLCLEGLSDPWDQNFGQWKHTKEHFDPIEDPQLADWIKEQRQNFAAQKLKQSHVQRLHQQNFVWDLKKHEWQKQFALLERYRDTHEHCQVPKDWPENPLLAKWVERQRTEYRKKSLDPECIAQLNRLEFVWDLEEAQWQKQFLVFHRFHQTQGHGHVPALWPNDPTLAEWCKQQRIQKQKKKLKPEHIQKLAALGFIWDLEQAQWESLFAHFLDFILNRKDGIVPEVWPKKPELAQWAKEQRRLQEKNKLKSNRYELLEKHGFCWDLEEAYWREMAKILADFFQREGHSLLPIPWPSNPALSDWVNKQRREYRLKRLTQTRIDYLETLDFVWDPEEKMWHDRFAELKEFHKTHDHLFPQQDPIVTDWIKKQRREYQGGRLKEDRVALMETLAFIWDPKEADWFEMFTLLKQFAQERNHCIVPTPWEENPKLSKWVTLQRKVYAQQTLEADKIQLLTDIGFIWDAKAVFWEEMFSSLAEYRDHFGNCLVPEVYPDRPQLAWWVITQRKAFKSGQLQEKRVERLNALGFFWDPLEAQWYEMYQNLLRYREQHQNCLVPRNWPHNPKLSLWVATQRQARIHGHLSTVRVERLDEVGFIWDPKEVILEEMLLELADFKKENGHCNIPANWKKNPDLGLWVEFQRQAKKKGQLEQKRVLRLEMLGFQWD